MDIRITGPLESVPVGIVEAWGGRLRDRLSERYSGRYTVAWTEDKEAPARTPPSLRHWLTIWRGKTLQGRAGLVWDQAQPRLLRLRTEAQGLPGPELRIDRVFEVLNWLLGVVGFGLWVWFVKVDWQRIWNRLSTFPSGYDATHATKLEVLWLLVGWALSPAVAVIVAGMIRALVEAAAEAWQRRRVLGFNRKDLDGTLESIVQVTLQESTQDPQACVALGQAHLGQPHPVHPNLVWAANGQYNPAEGYRWASEDPASLDVVRKSD